MQITIATRKSPLALWQANHVRDALMRAHSGLHARLLQLQSSGDKNPNTPLANLGGKGVFLKELEAALLRGDADLAVHSMKDVPAVLPDGLTIAAICKRGDVRDVFVGRECESLAAMPAGARVGSGSLRRQCQLRARYPRLHFVGIRGNVGTRLAKLDGGEVEGLVLAAAGLQRLGLVSRVGEYLQSEACLPAAGQGAIGVECRADNAAMHSLLRPLHDRTTALCVAAERAVNARLGGGCHMPIAAFAELMRGRVRIRGLVGARDGGRVLRAEREGDAGDAMALAAGVGDELLAQGAAVILGSKEK